ncbi:hypothetical protein pb186bvf_004962 [Paramecium bursaria]
MVSNNDFILKSSFNKFITALQVENLIINIFTICRNLPYYRNAQIHKDHSLLITLQDRSSMNIYSIKDRNLISQDVLLVNSFIINKSFINSIDISEKKLVKLHYISLKTKATFIKDSQETIIINNYQWYLRNFKRDYLIQPKYLYLRNTNYKQIRRLNQPQTLGGNYELVINHDYKNQIYDFFSCKNVTFQLDKIQNTVFNQNSVSVNINYCQNIEFLGPHYQSTYNLIKLFGIHLAINMIQMKNVNQLPFYTKIKNQYIQLTYLICSDNENLQVVYKNKMKIVIDVIKLNQFQFLN